MSSHKNKQHKNHRLRTVNRKNNWAGRLSTQKYNSNRLENNAVPKFWPCNRKIKPHINPIASRQLSKMAAFALSFQNTLSHFLLTNQKLGSHMSYHIDQSKARKFSDHARWNTDQWKLCTHTIDLSVSVCTRTQRIVHAPKLAESGCAVNMTVKANFKFQLDG